MLWKDSDEVAKMVVKSIKNHRSVLIPGILNKVIAFTSSSLPGNWTKKITAVVAKGRRTR
jgi:short-subunit dehydrogenase